MRCFTDEASAWSAALEGDGDAFGAIFDQNLDRVYRHALRLVGNAHDAEDLTAGAFFELWRRRSRVRVVEGSVVPWLLVTVGNLERNRARGLHRYRSVLAALPRGEPSRAAEDVTLEQMAEDDAVGAIREALCRLGPSDAALVALTAFDKLSPGQAAAALGIAPGAARTRLHRARTRMASQLGRPAGADR